MLALFVTVTAPVRVPPAVGVKVTLIAQFAPAASDAPQLFVCAKSPLAENPVMASGALPVLESVAVFALLVVPTPRAS